MVDVYATHLLYTLIFTLEIVPVIGGDDGDNEGEGGSCGVRVEYIDDRYIDKVGEGVSEGVNERVDGVDEDLDDYYRDQDEGFIQSLKGYTFAFMNIGIDDCILKTKFQGQLLSVVGRDSDGWIYPLA
ncbi:hypothetical protein K2173_022096 [Erythroxylum novogranatense]|uniref:Uncharacterized protein n=1 Tax=Erythroxylum novogranatense TaxID=1862640 RepID=A0AAV8TYE4_9ROSI|nr:hypothetical protein K2173_022096 [Erythroxylum novogranatense]